MEIRIVEEAGYASALEGLSFSFQTECDLQIAATPLPLPVNRARTLAKLDKGHNKFLESIMVWFDMRAPLYFWKQFDTYRVGVTKQSKSTMHTLMKRQLTADDFTILVFSEARELVNSFIRSGDFDLAIANLPDGYLQTRRVCCSYKSIRHILQQRQHHLIIYQKIPMNHHLF